MKQEQEAMMISARNGAAVPLKQVSITARLIDLLAVVEVTQTYRNEGKTDIEAVYTFPLPMDATLLDLSLAIGERRLSGQVVEKREAAVRYERAIESGNSALMLERAADGLCTLNLGHLRADEQAVVSFRYGLIGRWNGDVFSFRLPTTLAPRYGDAGMAGLSSHQEPVHAIDARYPFSLGIEAFGRLSLANIQSPSHAIAQRSTEGRTVVTLARDAMLDRDLVVDFTVSGDIPAYACYAQDGEQFAAWASFRPQLAMPELGAAVRSLRLVIDCSGSMGGESIAQAKEALLQIIDRLIPEDRFNITAFGSHHRHLFNQEAGVNPVNLAIARNWIKRLQADMGGTEMAAAVEAACGQEAALAERDILLVTDGEVWDDGRIVNAANHHRWRIFAVGVGSAPAEPVLRKISESTGGATELVVPGDDMSRRIVRHFERLREPQAAGRVAWPAKIEWQSGLGREAAFRCFHGDTINAFAVLADKPHGEIALVITQQQGERQFATAIDIAPAEIAADLPRLVAAQWLKQARPQHAAAIALRYQLLTEYTNYLVILERTEEEAGDGMPELQRVPQMLAAGWGGFGYTVDSYDDVPAFCRSAPAALRLSSSGSASRYDLNDQSRTSLYTKLKEVIVPPKNTPKDLLRALAVMCRGQGHPLDLGVIRNDRLRKTAPPELLHLIDELTAKEHDERLLWVIVAWIVMAMMPAGRKQESRFRLLIEATAAAAQGEVAGQLAERVAGLSENGWGKSEEREREAEMAVFDIPGFLRKQAD